MPEVTGRPFGAGHRCAPRRAERQSSEILQVPSPGGPEHWGPWTRIPRCTRRSTSIGIVGSERPVLPGSGRGRVILAGARWRRLAVLGDSIAAGVGDPVDGYQDRAWADRLAAALGVIHLNTGRAGAKLQFRASNEWLIAAARGVRLTEVRSTVVGDIDVNAILGLIRPSATATRGSASGSRSRAMRRPKCCRRSWTSPGPGGPSSTSSRTGCLSRSRSTQADQ